MFSLNTFLWHGPRQNYKEIDFSFKKDNKEHLSQVIMPPMCIAAQFYRHQQAFMKHHSEETLGMVQRLAEGGRLRPILSDCDAAIVAELERGAAATVRAAVASHAATDHATPFDDTSRVSELPGRVEAAAAQLQHRSGLLEREREVRIMLLAALAAEHLLIFGPPGTGKTTLCREAASLLGSGSAPFERLISKRRSFPI